MAESKQQTSDIAQEKVISSPVEGVGAINPVSESNQTTQQTTQLQPTSFEQGFEKHFMQPLMQQLEEKVKVNNDMLDQIQVKLDAEREGKKKKELSKHIPGPLQGHGQKLQDVMTQIQDLIVYESLGEGDGQVAESVRAKLRDLDENSEVAILSHSIAAYIMTLTPEHLKTFTTRIISDTTLWLSRLFRFNDSLACFHEEEREGLVKICRLALHKKYPKYATEGFEALYSRPPVIYISSAARPGLGQYVCSQLGLPISCLCTVPCNTMFGSQHKMDVASLEKLIQDDISSAKTPVLLVGYAGTPVVGHIDNLQRLNQICKKNDIWFHLQGSNLATLCLFSVPTAVQPAKTGDSMTLNIGAWLGLSMVPSVTLFRTADPAISNQAGLTTFNPRTKLTCLPLWLVLQNMGHEGVVNRIQYCCDLAKLLFEKIEPIKTIKPVSNIPQNKEKDNETFSFSELMTSAIDALVLFEIVTPTVVFKYVPASLKPGAVVANGETEESKAQKQLSQKSSAYCDALNFWLADSLARENTNVVIIPVDVEHEGICIRFAPLDTAQVYGTTKEDIEDLVATLDTYLSILDTTVSHRTAFEEVIEAQDNMILVEDPTWAGLGIVQYIPEHILPRLMEMTETDRSEVNHINEQIYHQLRSSDAAFSMGSFSPAFTPGKTDDDITCIKFGLITDDTDLEELIALVFATGKEVEDSSKFLETMSEVIRKGIEAANEDLRKENEEKLIQEGVLRQVPLVSSFVNWLSPPPKEAAVKGRTFSLASGKVQSTEETYKYHMQIQESSGEVSPDPAAKQAPLKTRLKPSKKLSYGHNKSGSTASTHSQESAKENHDPEPQEPATEETPQKESNDNAADNTEAPEAASEVTESAAPESPPKEGAPVAAEAPAPVAPEAVEVK